MRQTNDSSLRLSLSLFPPQPRGALLFFIIIIIIIIILQNTAESYSHLIILILFLLFVCCTLGWTRIAVPTVWRYIFLNSNSLHQFSIFLGVNILVLCNRSN